MLTKGFAVYGMSFLGHRLFVLPCRRSRCHAARGVSGPFRASDNGAPA